MKQTFSPSNHLQNPITVQFTIGGLNAGERFNVIDRSRFHLCIEHPTKGIMWVDRDVFEKGHTTYIY